MNKKRRGWVNILEDLLTNGNDNAAIMQMFAEKHPRSYERCLKQAKKRVAYKEEQRKAAAAATQGVANGEA
jgi:hypothetical protein